MFEVTLTIANDTLRVPVGDTGLVNEFKLSDIPAEVHAIALVNGYVKALNDTSRGKGEDDKPLSDAAWQATRQKRVDTWIGGQWAATRQGGGSTFGTAMAEAYDAAASDKTGKSVRQIATMRKDTVKAVFGDKEPATFARFLDAIATQKAGKDKDKFEAIRNELEAKWSQAARELIVARKEAVDDIDLADLDI